jgi:hypothetical protein
MAGPFGGYRRAVRQVAMSLADRAAICVAGGGLDAHIECMPA